MKNILDNSQMENYGNDTVDSQMESNGNDTVDSQMEIYGDDAVDYSLITITWQWTTYCQLVTAIIGIVGNGLVIAVYRRQLQAKTATNELLVALAVADMLTSVFMIPLPTLINVPQNWLGQMYCKFITSAIFMWISITVSVFTLTMVSVERYIAILYPSKYPLFFSRNSRSKVVVSIWIVAIVLNSYSFGIWISEDDTCKLVWPAKSMSIVVGVTLFFLKYLIPVLIMFLTQAATTLTLRSQQRDLIKREVPESSPAFSTLKVKTRVVRMLRIVVLMFIICWTTDQVGHLGFTLGLVPLKYLLGTIYRCFVQLAFCNSVINPFIYAFTNPHFRKGLRQLLFCTTDTKYDNSSVTGSTPLAVSRNDNKHDLTNI